MRWFKDSEQDNDKRLENFEKRVTSIERKAYCTHGEFRVYTNNNYNYLANARYGSLIQCTHCETNLDLEHVRKWLQARNATV